MSACWMGHIDIARMLVGEYHANIEIQTTVRAFAISRLWCCLSNDVFGGCARDSGVWECR